MYEIYAHTFKSSGKTYIGKTCKGWYTRLQKHLQLAIAGSTTKFHRAIIKYGITDIITTILATTDVSQEANQLESQFIHQYDSYKNGYNMTLGGDGGNVFDCLSTEKKINNRLIKSKQTHGCNNPTFCGKTDDEIIDIAVEYFKINQKIYRRAWFLYSKSIGLPQHYSKFRFGGKQYKGFVELLKNRLIQLDIPWNESQFTLLKNERYSSEVNKRISASIIGKKWYNDGNRSYQTYESDAVAKNLKLGRINVKNK